MRFIKSSFFGGIMTAVLIGVFFSGAYLGYENRPQIEKIKSVLNKEDATMITPVDFDAFWNVWKLIESKYVTNGQLDRQEMVWGGISGLVSSLDDPYSVFFPPKEAELFESSVRGDFEGVGMEIGIRDDMLTVVAPLKGTPADKAGIKSGDNILKIGDIITSDLAIDEAVNLIRGERGTKVALTIFRKGEGDPFVIEVTRDVIEIPVLETKRENGGIFVISLYNFSARSEVAFRSALREMIESGSTKLIIDLRGNVGGYLESAVDIASWFLPLGDIVAREKFGTGEETLYKSKGYDIFDKLPLVILVDGGTASASEILAGALREHDKTVLVGQKTYGKGSVQELMDIYKGSSLKLTIANWLTPNGISISQNGLDPDFNVELTKEDIEAGRDPQFEKALELLAGE